MPQTTTTTTMIAAQMSHTGMATQNGRYMLVLRLSRTLTPTGQAGSQRNPLLSSQMMVSPSPATPVTP
jgi:hypothetical protein